MQIERLGFQSKITDIPSAERGQLPYPDTLRHNLVGDKRDWLRLMLSGVGPFLFFWIAAIWVRTSCFVLVIIGIAFANRCLPGNRKITKELERLRAKQTGEMMSQCTPDEVTFSAAGITQRNAHWNITRTGPLSCGLSEGREGLYVWAGPGRVVHMPDAVLPDGTARAVLRAAIGAWVRDKAETPA